MKPGLRREYLVSADLVSSHISRDGRRTLCGLDDWFDDIDLTAVGRATAVSLCDCHWCIIEAYRELDDDFNRANLFIRQLMEKIKTLEGGESRGRKAAKGSAVRRAKKSAT